MKPSSALWLIIATYVAIAVPVSGLSQQPGAIDYDTFMQSSEQRRIELFNAVTPENRAELVRTHLERWLSTNRKRLSPEQIRVMEENLAFIRPAIYRQDRAPEVLSRQKELERRTAAIFTAEDMRQALTIHGDYIRKPDCH
jgi:hypothetical protein